MAQDIGKRRLNPCFSGTYSRRYSTLRNFDEQEVLILVLVEHTLGVFDQFSDNGDSAGLNPCFSGTYSRSYSDDSDSDNINVLILVLVEHTLGGAYAVSAVMKDSVLILVLVEHTLGAG